MFSTNDFMRALSYRDFFSPGCLALLVVALNEIVSYYSNDEWIRVNSGRFGLTFIGIMMVVNHAMYFYEHKRPNNYIGRIFSDFILLVLYSAISKLKQFLFETGFSINIENLGVLLGVLLVIFFFLAVYEASIALLKRLFRLFRWQIL